MNNKNYQNIINIIFGIILGFVAAFLVPFFLDIVLLTILLIFVFHKDKKIIIGSLVGYVFRILIVFIVLLFFWKFPHYINFQVKHPVKYVLLLGSEGGLYEGIIRHYCNTISKGDPFSGKFYKEINGNIYCVGPDGDDNRMSIIYDPTNGIISIGDIIVPIEKR